MASKDNQRDNPSDSKEEFCRFCHLLYERHLAAGVGGNIAARSDNRVLLTPTDYSLRNLHPNTVSVVNEKGLLMEGDKPTKEADMHLRILRERPDINVVFHLHGPHIIAASTMFEPGPSTLPALTPGFAYYAYPLPMIPFMVPGSPDLAKSVSEALSGKGSYAVLLKNHGLITVGKDFSEALNIAEEVDEAARVYLLTGGKAPPISSENIGHIKSLRNP
ncbi:MAG: class II aldolase/adducin family protein [Desulfobacteraceae bacterium]|jgi:ribulose-5-phosphate 4-epimerase/fuculose-1-phosphate aldolase|nr:class II aldolase/adducin family protein [Desulfobacteraceae bacterium]